MTTQPSTPSRKRRPRPAAGLPPLDDPGRLTSKAAPKAPKAPKATPATAPADPGIPPAFAPNTSFAPNT